MILYYALGGGLGHISRSIAILNQSPWLAARTRLMVSSALAGLAVGASPCPVDQVAGAAITSKRKYAAFLSGYLKRHRARLLIVDTFPSGVAGELGWTGLNIPALLVARHVKWRAYAKHAEGSRGIPCSHALAVEPLDVEQEGALKNVCEVSCLDSPVLLEHPSGSVRKRAVIVAHSGNGAELETLMKIARERAGGEMEVDVVSPANGVYPAERLIAGYSEIVSGAGYNMSALASQAPPGVTHVLCPFERRYDDQPLRARRIGEGMWSGAVGDGARKAANWLEERAEYYLR